ncbi:MAG TPA: alpha/beta hydrolase [Candidatus Saccharimonadales bacterium]|nr:alpha/beta hydrolase [Candidatus Saccharimonadales bacterium]
MKHWSVQYGSDSLQTAEIYSPGSAKPTPIVVFFHGGSWKAGSNRRYRFVGRALAHMGYVAVLPNYRLYPEVKFPTFLEDSATAVKWAVDHSSDIGGDPHQIFLMGHSAGAYNAAALAIEPKFLKSAGVNFSAIRGWIGLSGPYDFYPRPDLRGIFPLSGPKSGWNPVDMAKDISKPALLIHGRLDPIVDYRNSVSMGRRLGNHANMILYPHLEHFSTVGALSPGLDWIVSVRHKIREFLSQNSSN